MSGPELELSRAKRKSLTTTAFPSKPMALTQSQKHANAGSFRGNRNFVQRYINVWAFLSYPGMLADLSQVTVPNSMALSPVLAFLVDRLPRHVPCAPGAIPNPR
mgnify:CR=1 FL=1